ncbi:MAG TPA: TonB-dependent receptor [Cyclobacteriaceae bacterium]|nr:TonB-dependent receptor [Cyclobacteriaceae bacterium]
MSPNNLRELLMTRIVPLAIAIICLPVLSLAQEAIVSGKVSGTTGETIPGVNVLEKGTAHGTLTDADGVYTIAVQKGATLIFSYIGMNPQEVVVGDRLNIDITLQEAVTELDQVIVTGYATERKADVTGAVAVVKMNDVNNLPTANTITALQGRIPGVFIEADGRPNGGQRSILIRGLNTLGSTNPLFIIDGVPTNNQKPFQDMDPSLIESVQVLKDATAASIYGARASNGVVIVTTKKGKDKVQVNFNYGHTWDLFTSKLPVLDVYGRGQALWQGSINDGTDPIAHKAIYTYDWHRDANGVAVLDKVKPTQWVGGDPAGLTPGSNTDWQDEVFKTGSVNNTDLNISGGNENFSGVFGFNFTDNQGIQKYMQYQRYGLRVNTSYSFLKGKVKIGENLQVSKSRNTPEHEDHEGSGPILVSNARFMQPILPVFKTDGTYSGPIGGGISDRNNPVHVLDMLKDQFDHVMTTFGNAYLEVRPVKNLTLRSSFGVEYSDEYSRYPFPTYSTGFLSRTLNYMDIYQNHRINWTWSNTANYEIQTGQHSFGILAGTEAIKNNYIKFQAHKEGFAVEDDNYYVLSAATGNMTNAGSSTGNQIQSLFSKVTYNYGDRYLVSATIRRDGSSRFGPNTRYGVFPSVSAGWRVSNEKFMENVKFISNLKIRGGWGKVGNQEIGDVSRFGMYYANYGGITIRRTTGTAYDLNGVNQGTMPSGFSQLQTANDDLKWETTREVNSGIDFEFLDGKIFGSFDYFNRHTSDILILPPFVAALGEGGGKWFNGASVKNKGFEFAAGTRGNIGSGGLTYAVNINITSFHDKVTELPASVVRAYPGNVEKTILGHSTRELFGYVTDGLFQNQAEVDAHAVQPGKGIGRIKYKDLDGDGQITPLDQDWLGNTLPKAEYGINIQLGYKGFDFSLFTHGIYKRKIYNNMLSSLVFVSAGMNMGTQVLDAWTPQNTSSDIPMLSLVNRNNETRSSDFFVQSGDYFKIRQAEIGYSLSGPLASKLKIQRLRVYVLAQNFMSFYRKTGKGHFMGTDPALWGGNDYPMPTGISLGLNSTF